MKVTVKVHRNYSVWEAAEVELDVEEDVTPNELYKLASEKAEGFNVVWTETEKTFLEEEYEY